MKNSCAFYILFQVLKVLLMNICQVKPSDLLFLFILLAFTSAGIIFQKYLALSEKKIVTNFPFLDNSLSPTPFTPVMAKIC